MSEARSTARDGGPLHVRGVELPSGRAVEFCVRDGMPTREPLPGDPGLSLATPRPRRHRRRPRREIVPAGIRQLLDVLGLPGFVDRRAPGIAAI